MILGRELRWTILTLVAVAALGCSTAPSHFYTLDSTATPNGAPVAHIAVTVGPVSIPAAVDQPQFVVQVASNRVEIDEFNRWAAPLGESIARAVAGDLTVLLGTPERRCGPVRELRSHLHGHDRGPALRLDSWRVRKRRGIVDGA